LWIKEKVGELVALQTGGAQQHINKGNVEELAVTLPGTQVLLAWSKLARPIFDRIASACFESGTLSEARDYLLPRLMSGEVRMGVVQEVAA
jgi:type I restriction enzyme S subunit